MIQEDSHWLKVFRAALSLVEIVQVCTLEFAEDLEFWMIKEINLEVCCIDKFNSRKDHIIGEVWNSGVQFGSKELCKETQIGRTVSEF